MTSAVSTSRVRSIIVSGALTFVLAACGGGGDEPIAPRAPTVLPTSLTIAAPSTRQSAGSDVKLSSNTIDPERKLIYSWNFGDGTTGSDANVTHRYNRTGSYDVKLTVTNEAGAVISTTTTVKVAELALVQGKFCTGADSAGWCWQNPLPQGNLIGEQAWFDEKRGWAVGESGTILKTVDGGATWQPQASGVDAPLRTVLIVSPTVVWVGGDNGLLVITEDGGSSWRTASTGRANSLRGLQALDGRTAWLAENGVSITTLDGGLSWTTPLGANYNFYPAVVQTSPTQFWMTGNDASGAAVMRRSRDGGKTWELVALPAPSAPNLYRSINDFKFIDALRGFVVLNESGYSGPNNNYFARSVQVYTQDGGVSWQNMNPSSNVVAGYAPNYSMTPDGSIFSVNTYYEGFIERSLDGGKTWLRVPQPANSNQLIQEFTPRSATQAVMRNFEGRYFITSNGGESWVEPGSVASNGSTRNANSVWFFNSREGLALTSDGGSLSTTDGGVSWTPRMPPQPYVYGWRKLQFSADASVGWALSDSGEIYRSTDKGITWLSPVPQSSAPLGATLDFQFVDNNRGWALVYGYSAQSSRLFTTDNGGLSWQAIPGIDNLDGMRSLRFGDATHGVAVGSAGIAMVTSDGGASWQPRATGSTRSLSQLAFVDSRTVISVGELGTIVRSTDGGQTWTRIASPSANNLLNVRFINTKLGHAVGTSGTVLMTQDGGLSWTDISARTSTTLQSSFFLDEYTGWVVGDNGAILVTVAGGR
jgi:photosystem II stability/assembly factor-like uncharacterized protein